MNGVATRHQTHRFMMVEIFSLSTSSAISIFYLAVATSPPLSLESLTAHTTDHGPHGRKYLERKIRRPKTQHLEQILWRRPLPSTFRSERRAGSPSVPISAQELFHSVAPRPSFPFFYGSLFLPPLERTVAEIHVHK